MKSYKPCPKRHSTSRFFLIATALLICGCGGPATLPSAAAKKLPAAPEDASMPTDEIASGEPQPTPMRMTDDAFRFAAYEGKIDSVREGIAAGNNVNAVDERSLSPLHMAAFNGNTDVVKLLLEHGATLDAKDAEGKTPLLHACTGPFAETVEVLIAAGADVNTKEATEAFTPLMMAAGIGHIEVVKVLLKHKADKDVLDNDGDSALQHAQNSGHTAIVEILGK